MFKAIVVITLVLSAVLDCGIARQSTPPSEIDYLKQLNQLEDLHNKSMAFLAALQRKMRKSKNWDNTLTISTSVFGVGTAVSTGLNQPKQKNQWTITFASLTAVSAVGKIVSSHYSERNKQKYESLAKIELELAKLVSMHQNIHFFRYTRSTLDRYDDKKKNEVFDELKYSNWLYEHQIAVVMEGYKNSQKNNFIKDFEQSPNQTIKTTSNKIR